MRLETGGDFSTPREIGPPICKATVEQVRVKGSQRYRLTPLWSNSSGHIIARKAPSAHARDTGDEEVKEKKRERERGKKREARGEKRDEKL